MRIVPDDNNRIKEHVHCEKCSCVIEGTYANIIYCDLRVCQNCVIKIGIEHIKNLFSNYEHLSYKTKKSEDLNFGKDIKIK
jgi:hypothetical protein